MVKRYSIADVAELVDALDLGSSTARCEGSSPFVRIYPVFPGNRPLDWISPNGSA